MKNLVKAASRDIRRRVLEGEWQLEDKIDTFAELQRRYRPPGVSSVQKALAPLKREGLLQSEHGRGHVRGGSGQSGGQHRGGAQG